VSPEKIKERDTTKGFLRGLWAIPLRGDRRLDEVGPTPEGQSPYALPVGRQGISSSEFFRGN